MSNFKRHGQQPGRGARRPPAFQHIFKKPANDNRAGSGHQIKRFMAVCLIVLLALSAIWANG
ncbi:hypothetical protein MTBLM1_10125 [Rhodospirillaceae bacterium LM-1]|nr:hypothetical protein MTBLM1_10125 [Rhodospirillaceae bacterium LM-1]